MHISFQKVHWGDRIKKSCIKMEFCNLKSWRNYFNNLLDRLSDMFGTDGENLKIGEFYTI